MNKTILFLTTANLTTNPRCLKEVYLALEMGYQPIVIAFRLRDWSEEIEQQFITAHPQIDIRHIEATRESFISWFTASVLQKVLSRISFLTRNNIHFLAYAINKRSFQIIRYLRANKIQATMVVAHNLGAFFPAYYFSQKNKVPLGIDVEDYHSGESSNYVYQSKIQQLMGYILPKASYISFAAPLIMQRLADEVVLPETTQTFVINNVFTSKEFCLNYSNIQDSKLHMVWFSQNIDYGRGLEKILSKLDMVEETISLTLIGNMRIEFYKNELEKRNYINIVPAMLQEDLHANLRLYDIGLAIEDITADENRDICLTNKIWSYFQAGLYILATETKAQTLFVETHRSHAQLINLAGNELVGTLKALVCNSSNIQSLRKERFDSAKEYCWENESKQLKQVWEEII